jgi:CTP:molybdopterin cytidylyltransferase MocA/HD superfamily phosphohydrolase YqeK
VLEKAGIAASGDNGTVGKGLRRVLAEVDMTSRTSHDSLGEPAPKLAAVVLAAGYSSRMGQLKPLLSVGHGTALEAVVRLFQSAGIPNVFVVLGHRADELRPVAEAAGARCVFNPNFDEGMFSSVCAGVAALPTDTDACFVMPADMPLVRASTVRRLANYYAAKKRVIVYPVFQKRRGHPPLIGYTVLSEALRMSPDARLSTLLAAHESGSCNLFVPDEGVRLDMDTPDELARVRQLAVHREIPSLTECEAILAEYQAEERVARHSRKVAQVASRITVALAESGVPAEPLLASAGGLLHDLAKGQPDHATAGAQLLHELEFGNVADVVAPHTDYEFNERKLDEAAVVYLADKLVSGERVVSLAERFGRSLERFRENPVALAAAGRRRATAEAIAHEIERRLGVQLHSLIEGSLEAEASAGKNRGSAGGDGDRISGQ